ncbi:MULTISPECIES: cell division protein FtsB [Ectothiorhodospira]|uniref:cell division protein FtsB n=1 Tax=Ectothiorhodospira TaxID=1051 RepID=UPI00024A85D6|nr:MULTISPECIES: cell division protein FtsB [Ectothiorhodospira]EHQ53464.1 Septum formation initiator [Ectothiorhodospira sp. PHS-1]MCG5501250.1 cell division protein FtsB [Ectothiorhodospira lacustris]MCG5509476.1 cell division protein FtsB [Ectothiorhodospira lacustris]MCG5521530.1 cell division protein FtsB [Ectothiorhodospira lacustris]
MKWLITLLLALFLGLQYKLWFGEGSLVEVWQLRQELEIQRAQNQELRGRNEALEAEVIDLKTGLEAIEERARRELGMIAEDEIFFQVVDRHRFGGQR